MKDTINERILLLKTQSGLTNLDFCHKANISHGTLNNIQNGENVSAKTAKTICDALNVNKEWLLNGKGKIYQETPKETSPITILESALVKQLQGEVQYYRELLKIMAGGGQSAKHSAIEYAGLNKYLLPGQSFDSVRALA